MNLTGNKPFYFTPQMEFGENSFGFDCPELQMCDKLSETNYSGADFLSSKKPRISESVLNSSSGMSISSTFRLKQVSPINAKSEPCLLLKRGYCKYGTNCIFRHDETLEARKLLISQFNGGGCIVTDNQHGMMSRVKLCWFFMNGKNCPYGNRCHFLHQDAKNVKGGLDVPREKVAVTVVSTGAEEGKKNDELDCKRIENVNSEANQIPQKSVLRKTRRCHKWERNGSCPYGVKCIYAHGERELQTLGSFRPLESGKSFLVENLAIDTENAASTKKEIRVYKQQERSKKCLVKWAKIEKLSGIYADWIEIMPPVHASPGIL